MNDSEFTIEQIGQEIMEIAENDGLNYIEACIAYCDDHDIDYDEIAGVVEKHQKLKLLVQSDAQKLNFIKRETLTEFQYE